ncbi:MAG: hypothetical protein QOF48_2308 [Verrucomicrobiota bacterium]|jgi:hypothetical protein
MTSPAERARFVRDRLPAGGLFADQHWRIGTEPFSLGPELVKEFDTLGRVLLQFYRAVNLLYRRSVEGKQPEWVAQWLDQGKPASLVTLQRSASLRNEMPRVLRPDCLVTADGLAITELDSVPGGIGLTAWLNETYAASGSVVVGGASGMMEGFAGIFGAAARVRIIVSEEAAGYRPEMEWLANRLGNSRFHVENSTFDGVADGDAVYRFFELFDLANVPVAAALQEKLEAGRITVTPPPKAFFEEKLLFALLWNRNLRGFWRQELGESFFQRLLKMVPYTWAVDPAPLPPHAALPELNLTDWQQLKTLSQREREMILKVSGYSEEAWGARGVYFGSDLSSADWSMAVDKALSAWPQSPYVLQRYHKPRLVETAYFDFEQNTVVPMPGRARLCPYYFVSGDGDKSRATLGGILATICPADKKIIHGMKDAVLVPCVA